MGNSQESTIREWVKNCPGYDKSNGTTDCLSGTVNVLIIGGSHNGKIRSK